MLLAFDADAAGREASLRGMDLARSKGLNVRIVRLPGGRDPADVAGDGSGAFQQALDAAAALPDLPGGAGAGRRRHPRRALRPACGRCWRAAPPSVERDELVRTVADRLELSDDLTARLTTGSAAGCAATDPRRCRGVRMSPRERDERLFLGLCLRVPEARA